MWPSSWWKRRTRVNPLRDPEFSFLRRQKSVAAALRENAHKVVPVQRREIGITHREISYTPAARSCLKHQAMSGAVHWLQPILLVLPRRKILILHSACASSRHFKHVFLVVLPVPRGLPQRAFVDVGCEHLLEPVDGILRAQERDKLVVDVRSIWEEERRAGRGRRCDQELLGCRYRPMVRRYVGAGGFRRCGGGLFRGWSAGPALPKLERGAQALDIAEGCGGGGLWSLAEQELENWAPHFGSKGSKFDDGC